MMSLGSLLNGDAAKKALERLESLESKVGKLLANSQGIIDVAAAQSKALAAYESRMDDLSTLNLTMSDNLKAAIRRIEELEQDARSARVMIDSNSKSYEGLSLRLQTLEDSAFGGVDDG